MREILFRGKRTDNGEWVEGYAAMSGGTFIICDNGLTYGGFEVYKVIPETVGQYTGLTDKNGVKIFEGDILAARFDEDFPENITIVQVVWNEYGWYIKQGSLVPDPLGESDCDLFGVIGNIHDNPELLKGGEDNV